MKFAYADPPYIGMAHRYPEKEEVDHEKLIGMLVNEYPDGWALSCHTPSLQYLLPLCPEETRVMAWVKPWCSWRPGLWPAYAWEPILVLGGRKIPRSDKSRLTPRDWISANAKGSGIHGVLGAKPYEFCAWLFEVLGMEPTDEFHDLFPGSGAVSRAWEFWKANQQMNLALPNN